MSISFGSIQTGLPKDIVQKIMAAERGPINRMEGRKGKFSEKMQLVAELTKLVKDVRGQALQSGNSRSLRELQVMTNEDIVNVKADKNVARPGSYQFEVVDLARKSSAMTSGFEDPKESYVGVGYIQYTLPNGENREVYVDSDNASLEGIAKLINRDSSNGMRANVVNDGSGSEKPWRLILSLDDTGDENFAEFPYFYFVDGEDDLFLEFERGAQDAIVKLDGFEIEVGENKANDLIPGLDIDLKKAKPGEEFSIQVTEDVAKISEKLDGLIGSINDVLKFIHTQNNMDENTDTSRTLGGDVVLQSIESKLRRALFQPVETEHGMKRLSDLGIRFQKSGFLQVDSDQLESALANNFEMVSQILTGFFKSQTEKTNGVINNIEEAVGGILRTPDGLLPSRKSGLDNKIDQIDRRIQQRERMLEQKEENLKMKFARLEGTISRIKSQGAGLAGLSQQAASNPVTQLAG